MGEPRKGWISNPDIVTWDAWARDVYQDEEYGPDVVECVVFTVDEYERMIAERERMRKALVRIAKHRNLPEPCTMKCLDDVVISALAALKEAGDG